MFDQAERDRLLREDRQLAESLARGVRQVPPMSESLKEETKRRRDLLLKRYFESLPRMPLSRCPWCLEPLVRTFDPWGLQGFWWQLGAHGTEPEPCPHFRLLLGAVNLNGLPPSAGGEVAPGPEVPYVIPRILAMPTMIAVIAAQSLENGYTAFPIAYFSEVAPPQGSLTAEWNREDYVYEEAPGRRVWTVRRDPWDFGLGPWVDSGKVCWIAPSDERLALVGPPVPFPYADLSGRRERLVISGSTLTTLPPPAGEEIDPFE